MRQIKESEQYKGYDIEIVYDWDNSVNPREDWDNLGTIYSNHRDYNPDNHKIDELQNDEGVIEYDAINRDYIWLLVSCYEHSGITFWCGDYHNHYDAQWDCGVFGIIAVSKEKVRKEYGWKLLTKRRIEHIEKVLRVEIKTLDSWAQGEVYGFVVRDSDEEVVDSCWGYIGDDEIEYMYSEAKSIVDAEVEKKEAERAREAHMEWLIDLCWTD